MEALKGVKVDGAVLVTTPQLDRQIDRETNRQTDRYKDRQTYRHRYTDRQKGIQIDTQTDTFDIRQRQCSSEKLKDKNE